MSVEDYTCWKHGIHNCEKCLHEASLATWKEAIGIAKRKGGSVEVSCRLKERKRK